MARPMLLMQPNLLRELHYKSAQGVPVLVLIRSYKLEGVLTAPTLSKLLSYMLAIDNSQDSRIKDIISKSLFPQWLVEQKEVIAATPNEWVYSGRMPLGVWVKRAEYVKPQDKKESNHVNKTKLHTNNPTARKAKVSLKGV